ncbi:hypothetical protein AUC70_02610 [Methyloceanibacter stevinii]|uniref:YCII-related domain-containing protein n=1 Tax=Methyloceanibacter stevinii TaxID=1774970 RepID=A0A1E3VQI2_9HYPH|nr:YciI family protein [Methyloceanibacter stevinii]ODR95784.1 hypothetical protein AUC70_02610 [Methyloceanibacter stevinii]
MYFAFICTDKPDGLPIRKAHRPEHLAYLQGLGDALKFAGPFTAEDGETMTGSLVVIEAPSLADAQAIADKDPFAKAGLFASVDIRPWKWSLGKPEE